MKRFQLQLIIYIVIVLQAVSSSAQETQELDSLEQRLGQLRNTKPDEVIGIGKYIIKHSASDRQKSHALVFMSFAYYAKKDSRKFTELLFRSKEIAEQTNDPEIITKIYGTIAQMYLMIGFKEKANEYLNQAIGEMQKMPDGNNKYRLKGLSFIELGKINLSEKKNKKANVYFKRSLTEFNKMDENALYFIKRSYYNLGDSFYEMNKPDSAQLYLKKALQIKDNATVNDYALFALSKIYTAENQHQRAIDTLSAVLDRNQVQDDILRSEIYLSIVKNYNVLGNTVKANFFNEKYLALTNEVSNNNLSTIKDVVKIEQKDLTKKIASAHQQNNRLLLIIVLIFFMCTSILLYLRQKKKMQRNRNEAIIIQLEKRAAQTDLPPVTDSVKDASVQVISPEIEQAILEKLAKFEQSDKFTNPKLNISAVSILVKTNTTYLSQIINKYKGKNFSAYINELRINYICNKIHNNPEYLAYKISYLGELAGFTSHSTFTTIFKSVTGMSPSTFLKSAESSKKKEAS